VPVAALTAPTVWCPSVPKQEVFEGAGWPVVSLRIHKDTGQPLGICEFHNVQAAEAAIRFFNGYWMNGRLLTVDHAHGNMGKSTAGPSITRLAERGQQVAHGEASQQAGDAAASGMGEVASTLNNMTARQMYELIGQLKVICVEKKEEAKALMTQNQHLCCGFLRMQERLGMLTGINLPAPPARAPAPNPVPSALPPVEAVPYYNQAPQGTGWNVPPQGTGWNVPPLDRAPAKQQQQQHQQQQQQQQQHQQHAPYDAYAHAAPGAGGMAGPGGGAPLPPAPGGAPLPPAPGAAFMHNHQASTHVFSLRPCAVRPSVRARARARARACVRTGAYGGGCVRACLCLS
jgi:hypothetical protein